MITHAALVATIAGCNQYLASFNESLGPEDSYLSFLPLAHVFDRCAAAAVDSLPRHSCSLAAACQNSSLPQQ
jgi:long-subunit acyl-CoA synthetase (AMP-forming)